MVTTPAPRVYVIAFTVPAGTPSAVPVSAQWTTEDNTVVDIELMVPPGHNGMTGIRIMKGDIQLIPWSRGTFIIANDYDRVFPLNVYLPTADVTLQGYNTGAYPHTFYLRMTVATYIPDNQRTQASPSDVIPPEPVTAATDPLSPDAIIGPDNAAALTDGTITAADLAPVGPADLILPPQPMPTGA